MINLVCYDIATATQSDARRLRAVAKLLERHGHRVQKSVFEVTLQEDGFAALRHALLDTLDCRRDSLLIYRIEGAAHTHTEVHGPRDENDLFAKMIV